MVDSSLQLTHSDQTRLGAEARLDRASGSVTLLIRQWQNGEPAAAGDLWRRYFPRLRGLARKTLSGLPQRVSDADDAAQSAFVCFWKKIEQGGLPADLCRNNLWNLLATITVRKALKQVAREKALKRGGGKVAGESALWPGPGRDDCEHGLDQVAGRITPDAFDLHCEELLEMLGDDLRTFAILRMAGFRNDEIAQQLGCTVRKVERKLNLVRLKWEAAFSGETRS